MLTAVAFCPQAPVLVPDLAQGAAGELDDLRASCRTAIGRIAAPGRRLVVLGGGARSSRFGPAARGSFAGFGLPLEVSLGADGTAPHESGPVELPASLAVGAWLLRDALGPDCGATGLAVSARAGAGEPITGWDDGVDVGVLVIGDGSARHSSKAPGYLDPRAAAFDAQVAAALRGGVPGRLRELDDAYGDQLAAGVPVWEFVAPRLQDTSWDAELLYAAAPYGVGYFVASWTRRG